MSIVAKDVERWPHQLAGVKAVTEQLTQNPKWKGCLTSPTGSGKSLMAGDIAQWCVDQGKVVFIYVNRKLITRNLVQKFDEYGLRFGVEAAGWEPYQDLDAPIQIRSKQTIHSRILGARKKQRGPEDTEADMRQRIPLGSPDVVLIDEAHLRDGRAIFREHDSHGCAKIGLTATPLGINEDYPSGLIVAGTKRQLFKYDPPALIPCHCSAIEEWDITRVRKDAKLEERYEADGQAKWREVKRDQYGEYVLNDNIRKVFTQHIVGSVIENYEVHGEGRHGFCYASGVPESVFFCEKLNQRGHKAAHIDATRVIVDGKVYTGASVADVLEEVFERTKPEGDIKLLCNRFKLRESFDAPWMQYMIIGTPVGSTMSYIQMTGRIQRYDPEHPDCQEIRIQDHGGVWYNHPSPNDDIDWHTYWDLPVRAISTARQRDMEDGRINPGIRCPFCTEVMKQLPSDGCCRSCGKEIPRGAPVRRVVQEDGELKDVTSFLDIKPKRIKKCYGTQQMWERIYWSHRKYKKGRTFGQAWAWFCKQHVDQFHYHPPRGLPLMPRDSVDWLRPVGKVPMERLIETEQS